MYLIENNGVDVSIGVAEREGFEPSIELPLYTLSKRAPSTTRPSLRRVVYKIESGRPTARFSVYHAAGSGQIELLAVQQGIACHQHRALQDLLEFLDIRVA